MEFLLLAIFAFIYRIPFFLNPELLSSDVAIVGLQAISILKGNWDWFVWGTGYQGALEPLLAAISFKYFGATPRVLMMVAFVGHLLQLFFTYEILRRYTSQPVRFLICLLVTIASLNLVKLSLFPPRQWAITTLFFGIWCAEMSARGKRPLHWLFSGVVLVLLSLYVDFITLIFLIPALAFCASVYWDSTHPLRGRKEVWKFFFAGFVIGAGCIGLARLLRPHGGVPIAFSFAKIPGNLVLFLSNYLPIIIGDPLLYSVEGTSNSAFLFHWVTIFFSIAYVGIVLLCAYQILQARRLDARIRLSLFGLGTAAVCILGFVGSPVTPNAHTSRYLAPLIWVLPFLLLPIGLVHTRQASRALAVVLAISFLSGWVSFFPYVQNGLPVRDPNGEFAEEERLYEVLEKRGIRLGKAPYWMAYRLGFLSNRNLQLFPFSDSEDRNRALTRELFSPDRIAQNRIAVIRHPKEQGLTQQVVEDWAKNNAFSSERYDVGRFSVTELWK